MVRGFHTYLGTTVAVATLMVCGAAHAQSQNPSQNQTISTLARMAAPVHATDADKLKAYLAQSPVPLTGAPQQTPPPPSSLAVSTPAATSVPARAPDQAMVDSILNFDNAPPKDDQGTRGLSLGQAVHPYLPSEDDFAHQAARAIVEAFGGEKHDGPAGDAATPAAADTPAPDPDLDERINLVTTLYQVDGTEAVIRNYVATQHMKLIIKEVNNHVDISRLSQPDKYRLAGIAAVAQTQLEDKIIGLNARIQAANLSKDDLMQLIVAYDSDAQRKLTAMRLQDSGKDDQVAGIDVLISEYTILRDYIEQQ